jgi:Na+/H+ antiporter NhaA
VNEGLMTFFFLVVGLEAKRELDLGELRERRRLTIPVVAALGGMSVPVAIYLAINAGGPGAHGWGAAMSTDTALALGALALLTPRAATRLRVFLLTLSVVDDLVALVVIATAYTSHVSIVALAVAVALFGALLGLRYLPLARGPASVLVAIGMWVALLQSGVDPVVAGLAAGLVTSAYPPERRELEQTTALARSFREQPTPELARSVQRGVLSVISANERMQYELHPWVSYAVLPLFALANAGVALRMDAFGGRERLMAAILAGLVVGKPFGIMLASALAVSLKVAVKPREYSWAQLAGAGALAGTGFHHLVVHRRRGFPGGGRFPRRQDRGLRRLDSVRRHRRDGAFARRAKRAPLSSQSASAGAPIVREDIA